MALNAASLTRRIQVQRVIQASNGGGGFTSIWVNHGAALYARRLDVSDAERMSGGKWGNKLVTRFVVRADAQAREIRHTDRLNHEGLIFAVDGIKEMPGNRAFLEITAWSEGSA